MSIVWVSVVESDEEGIETVRIEQPVDYVIERPKKMTRLGIAFSAVGWVGFAWLMWCVLARVAR